MSFQVGNRNSIPQRPQIPRKQNAFAQSGAPKGSPQASSGAAPGKAAMQQSLLNNMFGSNSAASVSKSPQLNRDIYNAVAQNSGGGFGGGFNLNA